jgi:hypothetical protein
VCIFPHSPFSLLPFLFPSSAFPVTDPEPGMEEVSRMDAGVHDRVWTLVRVFREIERFCILFGRAARNFEIIIQQDFFESYI